MVDGLQYLLSLHSPVHRAHLNWEGAEIHCSCATSAVSCYLACLAYIGAGRVGCACRGRRIRLQSGIRHWTSTRRREVPLERMRCTQLLPRLTLPEPEANPPWLVECSWASADRLRYCMQMRCPSLTTSVESAPLALEHGG